MRVFVTTTRTRLPMSRHALDASSMTARARALLLSLLACGPVAAGAQTIPADAEPGCHAVHVDRTITLSGRYALDYGDESIGPDVGFEEDDASARHLPDHPQRAGVIVFTNQSDARRVPVRRACDARDPRSGDRVPGAGNARSCAAGEGRVSRRAGAARMRRHRAVTPARQRRYSTSSSSSSSASRASRSGAAYALACSSSQPRNDSSGLLWLNSVGYTR